MKLPATPALVVTLVLAVGSLVSTQTPQAPNGLSDLYLVNFLKAAPGQAATLAEGLKQPNPASPMPDHFVVLRHQEGDDWDYAIIRHLGQTTTLEPGPAASATANAADPGLVAWHSDAYVAGPAWPEFTKQMGIGGAGTATAVYALGVHNPVPGHTADLMGLLNTPAAPAANIEMGAVFMRHVDGGPWLFLTISRYNSWQDLGADRAAATADASVTGWADIRKYSAFHRDTIVDRIFPAR
jgi:hypothetical protein